jgi:hypothetical protein
MTEIKKPENLADTLSEKEQEKLLADAFANFGKTKGAE